MNRKAVQITIILVIAFAILGWLRSDGAYDFDIRTILPFLSGRDVGIYDWGGLTLLGLGLWGIGRLTRGAGDGDTNRTAVHESDDYEIDDDIDNDASVM